MSTNVNKISEVNRNLALLTDLLTRSAVCLDSLSESGCSRDVIDPLSQAIANIVDAHAALCYPLYGSKH